MGKSVKVRHKKNENHEALNFFLRHPVCDKTGWERKGYGWGEPDPAVAIVGIGSRLPWHRQRCMAGEA